MEGSPYNHDFDFEQFRSQVKSCRGKYDETKKMLRSELLDAVITPYTITYTENDRKMFASDGSYITYWKVPAAELYLGAIRIGYAEQLYHPTPKPSYETTLKGRANYFVPINLTLKKVESGVERLTVQDVLEIVMGALERKMLCDYAKEHRHQIVVVDGALQHQRVTSRVPTERYVEIIGEEMFKIFSACPTIDDIAKVCTENDHIFVGLSKDSSIRYKNWVKYEQFVTLAAEAQCIPATEVYYYKLGSLAEKDDAPYHYQKLFAKLHPRALKVHRIDYLVSSIDLDTEILPALANYSQLNRMYGTPVVPQICHKIAVRLRRLSEIMRKKIIAILKECDYTSSEIWNGLTDVNGDLLNAFRLHDILDRL